MRAKFSYLKNCVLLYCLIYASILLGQYEYKGSVVDISSGKGIINVLVQHKATNTSVFTSSDGSFHMQLPTQKNISLHFIHLSYVNEKIQVPNNKEIITVFLEENNLRIHEIEIIGKRKEHSEIVLKKEAIQNVQAFTALEVLEQLPGQSVSEFSLNSVKNIVFRTAEIAEPTGESYGNKAFGTAIVLNDIPLSNNENMQSWAPNSSGVFNNNTSGFGFSNVDNAFERNNNGLNSTYTNAGFGSDLRQISTQNIEEIEIVQGIPDAKYGDLTSGLIKIKTKAGVTPFKAALSFRDGTTQISTSKGFKVSDKLGFLNISTSYLNAKEDPKDVLNEYNRIHINTDWSLFKNNIKNTFSVNLMSSLDDGRQDPDDIQETYIENEEKSISLSNRFNYAINNKWIDKINLNTNFSYKTQHSLRRALVNLGGTIIPVSLSSGISEGLYTPVTYYATREVDGKPIRFFTDFEIEKKFTTVKEWHHKINIGTTFNYSDNLGAGRIGNPETADDQFTLSDINGSASIGFRPYSFNENLTSEKQFSVYLQDNITKHWLTNHFNIALGLRWDNQNGYDVLSPRINSYYRRNKLKFRAGFGIASKSPSLNSLYTGTQYFDNIIGDFRSESYNVAYVQTFVKEAQNLALKPTKSINSEIGIDYKINKINLSITAFHKNLYDGLTTLPVYNTIVGDDYVVVDNTPNAPTINVVGQKQYIYEDSKTINGLTSKDYGIEFSINFPKVVHPKLDLNINGLYAQTSSFNTSDIYTYSTVESEVASIGVFTSSYKNIRDLFRLSSNLTYHISKVGLLFNIKTEHFLVNKTSFGDAFEKYPVAYLDDTYNYFDIPEADRDNEQLYGHLFRNENTNVSDANVYHNLHLRVSKDFTNGFRVDFYANNFLNFQPTFTDLNGDIQTINISLSFGMQLNYQF